MKDSLLCIVDGIEGPPLDEPQRLAEVNASILAYITDVLDASKLMISAQKSSRDQRIYLSFHRAYPDAPTYKQIAEMFDAIELPGGGTIRVIGMESMKN